mgnify:CR=1 FL=1
MYEIYQSLLDKHNLKNSDISKATGISNMTLSDWKNGKYTPKADKLQIIANFFHVSVNYLMTGKEPEEDFSDEAAHLVAKIRKDTELSKALQKYFELSDAKKKHVVELINLLSE